MSATKQLACLPAGKCADMQYIIDKWDDEDDAVSHQIDMLKAEFWAFYHSTYPELFANAPVVSSIGVAPCGTEGGSHIGLRFSDRGDNRNDFYSSEVDGDTDFQVFVNLKTGEAFILYLNGGGSNGCIVMMNVLDVEWFMLHVMFGMSGGMKLGDGDGDDDTDDDPDDDKDVEKEGRDDDKEEEQEDGDDDKEEEQEGGDDDKEDKQ
jgi:hypothetical protein